MSDQKTVKTTVIRPATTAGRDIAMPARPTTPPKVSSPKPPPSAGKKS